MAKTTVKDLKFDNRNANKHSEYGMQRLEKSIGKIGLGRSILISDDNEIIAGNGVTESAINAGIEKVRIIETDGTEIIAVKRTDIKSGSKEFYEMALSDNIIAKENIVMDVEVTNAICEEYDLEEYKLEGENKEVLESEEDDEEIIAIQKLKDKFIIPPFSILNTREGNWQERKKIWKNLILDNGESRKETLGSGGLTIDENTNSWLENPSLGNGVSILDPVLSEIINKWFGFEKCNTFDCFAGDSVFGYVSSYLGNQFTGIELRQEQADLNNQRIKGFNSKYICDDGRNVLNYIQENSQDLLFSCPPYFDLEVYSDLTNDASNQKEYKDFIAILDAAFTNAIKCLKENRFAVIVCGDIRDKKGNYYRFPDHIKEIFEYNGMPLYNELILIEPIAFGAIRAVGNMTFRKITKCHQNVLVFFKGNPKEIKNIFPKIEIVEDESADV